jgi:hypothetical protein
MKAGKTNIEINARVVIVESVENKWLGATGHILAPRGQEFVAELLLDEPLKYGMHRINLKSGDKVLEINEDDGMQMAGKTNIPINERVKVFLDNSENIVIGYITDPISGGTITQQTEYVASVRVETPNGIYPNDLYNVTEMDNVIRFPICEEEGNIVRYLKDKNIFDSEMDLICYSTLDGDNYTRRQFIEICKGQVNIAEIIFNECDWQHPETYLTEVIESGLMAECEKCGKIFVTHNEDAEESFCQDCNQVCIDTPNGFICVEKKGAKGEYPGFFLSVKNGDKDHQIACIEYDSAKKCFQVVAYADPEKDEPSNIIMISK